MIKFWSRQPEMDCVLTSAAPHGGEFAFCFFGIFCKKEFGNDELENGIAEEFEPLIVLASLACRAKSRCSFK